MNQSAIIHIKTPSNSNFITYCLAIFYRLLAKNRIGPAYIKIPHVNFATAMDKYTKLLYAKPSYG